MKKDWQSEEDKRQQQQQQKKAPSKVQYQDDR